LGLALITTHGPRDGLRRSLRIAWLIGALLLPLGAAAQPIAGQIIVDPDDARWLKRHGGSHLFICGPGEPEDFLYRGTRRPDGTRNGDQLEMIHKLIRHGGNCIYLQAVRTHGGDAGSDRTHNPFVDSDPARGLDERILDQWNDWFTLMDQHDILIYFFFYDDSARIWNTGDRVEAAERDFFERLVRRFSHHRNLIWIIGEESEERYTVARVQALAEVVRNADPHGHPIGNHHLTGTTFKAWRPGGALDHFSMQLSSVGEAAHAGAILAGRQAGGRYQVIYAESTAAPKDPDGMRHFAWDVAMGGLMPMIYTMDIANTPAETLAQCRSLQRFFEATDFTTMAPHDELRHAGTTYVLADPGRSYIAYSRSLSSELGLRALPAGHCTITWLDCRSGATFIEQHQVEAADAFAFRKPVSFGDEVAAWVQFPGISPRPRRPLVGDTAALPASHINQAPAIADVNIGTQRDQPLYIQLTFSDDDGPGPYTYEIVQAPQHGQLTGEGNDRAYSPKDGFAGSDSFTWQVHDGVASSARATVRIRVRAPAPVAP
jgi:hypothetical protein